MKLRSSVPEKSTVPSLVQMLELAEYHTRYDTVSSFAFCSLPSPKCEVCNSLTADVADVYAGWPKTTAACINCFRVLEPVGRRDRLPTYPRVGTQVGMQVGQI